MWPLLFQGRMRRDSKAKTCMLITVVANEAISCRTRNFRTM
jgi:hypothetical protein